MRAGTLLLLATRLALADATPPRPIEKNEGFVATENPRGVIVPAAHGGEFFYRASDGKFWTPRRADVRAFEDRAQELIGKKPSLAGHTRQYIGFLEGKRRWIWINFFCRSHVKDWTREVVLVKDGGDCYLQLEFDPKTRELRNLSVNDSG